MKDVRPCDASPLSIAASRLVWAVVGAACAAPAVWLWSAFVTSRDARLARHAETAAIIETCRAEGAVAVHILTTDAFLCASGSGRVRPPLSHPLTPTR